MSKKIAVIGGGAIRTFCGDICGTERKQRYNI